MGKPSEITALADSAGGATLPYRPISARDNAAAIRAVRGRFVELCHRLKLFAGAVVAINGSNFKAVNNRPE